MNTQKTYGSLATEYFDLAWPIVLKTRIEYYIKVIKTESQREPVLMAMCGTGRFLIPLLENGIVVDGLDASVDMLESCRRKCEIKGLKTNLYLQKLEELSVKKKYRTIFISDIYTIGNHAIAKKALQKTLQHLEPGGELIFSILTSPLAELKSGARQNDKFEVTRRDNSKIEFIRQSFYESVLNVEFIECMYNNIVNEKIVGSEKEILKVQYYNILEMKNMLESTGFSNIRYYTYFSDEIAKEDDTWVLFRCTK